MAEIVFLKLRKPVEKITLGFDEAGRGSVIGCMYVGCVGLEPQASIELRELGVRDSKKLSRGRREELLKHILDKSVCTGYMPVSPEEIDAENISRLFVKAIVNMVGELSQIIGLSSVSKIVIDLTGKPRLFREELKRIGYGGEIVLEHKADEKYVEAGAASIVAKVFRDREILRLAEEEGVEGSGYPADERTVEWLRKQCTSTAALPQFVRRSWKTLDRVCPGMRVEKKRIGQKTLYDYIREQ